MDNIEENKRIIPVDLGGEMQKSFISYAMAVIINRALPDVRDGLKPVHRRIIYAMNELGLTNDKAHKKCARIVGDTMGKYHPHGDSSIYDALVRMAQDFSMRYMLVDGHGNFGTIDGDSAAAMRYTEARLSKIANEMIRDIDKDTVDYYPNFDESLQQPVTLPARFPQLIVNGTGGIAVGMATNIPPHNLGETIDATVALLKDPDLEAEDLMEYIPGPDFPTGGVITGVSGIKQAYRTGRGRIRVRARAEIEAVKDHDAIIITEIPYQVNKEQLVAYIRQLVRDKKIDGIADVNDESAEDVRIVIDLKRGVNGSVILNRLYKHTQMQTTFGVIMIALVNGEPKCLSLKQALSEYIAYQEEVILRRTRYDLRKAQERAHLLEGLLIAQDNIDEVIRIIRTSYDNAKENLMQRFGLDDIQAQAILDMRLKALQGLDREKLQNEYQELEDRIAYYERVLGDMGLVKSILKDELTAIRDKYGDERRTEIQDVEDEIDIEDLIEEEDCCYTLSNAGYIKRLPVDTYRTQRRGGRGVSGQSLKEEDYVKNLFIASTHDYVLFFTNTGRVHRKKGYLIPEAGRTARGTNIVNILPLEQGERVTAMLLTREFTDHEYLMMVTRGGTVKRIRLDALYTARKAGIRALSLDDGDELIAVLKTNGSDNILLATRQGMAICFAETDVRPMGRDAAGVRGIRLDDGDEVVSAAVAAEGKSLLTVTENGYGKRTAVESYLRGEDRQPQTRGGKGLRNYRLTEKTGLVAGAAIVDDTNDVMLIESGGVVLRTPAASINLYGRDTQGVILMRIEEGNRVIGVEAISNTEETEESGED